MTSKFEESEELIRAILPENERPNFWRNGKLSSAALKDSRGLSVSRTYNRTRQEVVDWMYTHRFRGVMASISVRSCNAVEAYTKYCPSQENVYHSEIHGSERQVVLSDEQALALARQAILVRMAQSPVV